MPKPLPPYIVTYQQDSMPEWSMKRCVGVQARPTTRLSINGTEQLSINSTELAKGHKVDPRYYHSSNQCFTIEALLYVTSFLAFGLVLMWRFVYKYYQKMVGYREQLSACSSPPASEPNRPFARPTQLTSIRPYGISQASRV
jgi:hypothetical protein